MTAQEKIFAMHVTDKESTSLIHKELLQINKTKTNNSKEK